MPKINDNKKEKAVFVEILRIIAIIMVIGTHIALPCFEDNIFYKERVIISCFVGDGVAIFWMIMGFFYFNEQEYKSKVKKMSKKILLPLILWSIIYFFFYDFINGDKSFVECFIHNKEEYISIIYDGILKWQNVIKGAEHFWFLYIYILIVIIYPVLNKVREWIDKLNPKKVLASVFILLIINDIGKNQLMNFSHYGINGIFGAILFLLLGYILYKNKEKIKNKKSIAIICAILFIVINILRSFILYNNIIIDLDDRHVVFWYSSFGFINSIMIYYIVSCFFSKTDSKRINIIIENIGNNVFYIYIIHPIVILFLNSYAIRERILGNLSMINGEAIIFEIVYTFIVFSLSLILTEMYTLTKKLIKDFKYRK